MSPRVALPAVEKWWHLKTIDWEKWWQLSQKLLSLAWSWGGFLAEEETPCGNCQGTVGKWSLDGSQPPDPGK